MRIKPEETMALVVDFQEKLMPVIDQREEVICNAEKLVRGLKLLEIPMLVTQQYTKGIGMTVEEIQKAVGESFSYMDKSTFSCMQTQEIEQAIKESGKKNIILCGTEAHICVLQTAIDLVSMGYTVVLVVDCIGSRKKKDKKTGIQRAMQEGVLVTTYEAILFELTQKAGSETFKAISRLIK